MFSTSYMKSWRLIPPVAPLYLQKLSGVANFLTVLISWRLKALHHFSSTSLAFLLSEGGRGFLNNFLEVGESSDRTEPVEEELVLPMLLLAKNNLKEECQVC